MRNIRWIAFMTALPLALVACASGGSGGDPSQVGEPATISHIHGLGVDAQGSLHVATHFGLIKQTPDGAFVYASADRNDHMGFSLDPGEGIMYRSGHSPSKPSLGVQSSTDGATWTHLADVASPPVDFHAMAVSFADPKTLWGWDSGGRGTFRSIDGGKEWTRLETDGLERQIYVLSGPAEPNVVLAGIASGLYRSSDGGSSWEPMIGDGAVIGVGADPMDAKHLLVSTQRGVKVTRDGGDTWSDAGGGLPDDTQIGYLAISPENANIAYAADSSTVYRTNDGGQTWARIYPVG